MKLDVPTLFLGTICFEVFVAATMFLYGRHRRTYPGFSLWTASMLVVSASYIGLAVRPLVPLPASVLLVAGSLFLAAVLRLDAIRLFVGDRGLPRTLYLFPPVAGMAFGFLAWGGCPQATRALLQTVIFAGFILLAIETFLRAHAADHYLRLTAAALLIAQLAAMLGRAIAWWALPQVNPTVLGPVHGAFYSLTMVSELGMAAVFVLMNSTRLERDLAASSLELTLAVHTLQENLARLETLQGFLSICAHCKKIRVASETWEAVEVYVSRHSDLEFSHGTCDACQQLARDRHEPHADPVQGALPRPPELPGETAPD